MIKVHTEQADLSAGTALVYKDYGNYVRMAYDPNRIDEAQALDLLSVYVPRMVRVPRQVIHSAHA